MNIPIDPTEIHDELSPVARYVKRSLTEQLREALGATWDETTNQAAERVAEERNQALQREAAAIAGIKALNDELQHIYARLHDALSASRERALGRVEQILEEILEE